MKNLSFPFQLRLMVKEKLECVGRNPAHHVEFHESRAIVLISLKYIQKPNKGAGDVRVTVDDLAEFSDFLGDKRRELSLLMCGELPAFKK